MHYLTSMRLKNKDKITDPFSFMEIVKNNKFINFLNTVLFSLEIINKQRPGSLYPHLAQFLREYMIFSLYFLQNLI